MILKNHHLEFYLECTEENHSKFYHMLLFKKKESWIVLSMSGRIGSTQNSHIKEFKTYDKVLHYMNKKENEEKKKGYARKKLNYFCGYRFDTKDLPKRTRTKKEVQLDFLEPIAKQLVF